MTVIAVNLVMLIFQPQVELTTLRFAGKNFLNFLFMLTPIFVCVGLMDVWIERDTMVKIMGAKSGFKGVIVALLLGVVTAVPLYA
ncbi:MAG TPA: permease, partial [Firmicutes bacterium]|nr:permease [Bacillota bacterium]